MKKYFKLIVHPTDLILTLAAHGLLPFLSDARFLKLKFKKRIGNKLNLKNPVTFNEKLQWLKLYDRNPEYTKMVDKYAVKNYVASIIGEEYIIPTLGVWDSFDDIDFNKLPNQFVLKCTHDSGGIVICKDKSTFDIAEARKKLNHALKMNFYLISREWPYKDVVPRIIAEQYIDSPGKVVPEDYKVYCFGGKPYYIVVFHNRFNESQQLSETVYDINWEPQHVSLDEHFQICDTVEPRPVCFEKLLAFSEKLSVGIPQSRIDFYILNDKIYFGEITLYTASGFQKMIPEELDKELGSLIDLSVLRNTTI